jgi:hypothetical protein
MSSYRILGGRARNRDKVTPAMIEARIAVVWHYESVFEFYLDAETEEDLVRKVLPAGSGVF